VVINAHPLPARAAISVERHSLAVAKIVTKIGMGFSGN
jgi:hypothetical protein